MLLWGKRAELLTGLAEAGDALLQELQGEVRLVGRQCLADGHDEERIVGRDAQARRLQQLPLDLQVERAGQSTQQVVRSRSVTRDKERERERCVGELKMEILRNHQPQIHSTLFNEE